MAIVKTLTLAVVLRMTVILLLWFGVAQADDQCYTCHEVLGDEPSTLFKRDIHFQRKISCAGCHGGNPRSEEMEEAMSKNAGFIGVPKGDDISAACAKCHSEASIMVKRFESGLPMHQLETLAGSVHGKLSTSGKARIAQCTTCHGAHGIVSVKNPASPVYPLNVTKTCGKCHSDATYMKTYNPALPIDQVAKYRTSVHGVRNAKGDPKPAECVSCHGSHDIRRAKDAKSTVYATNIPSTCAHCHSSARYMKGYGIPSDQYEKFSKSIHGVALLEKGDVGAPACNDCHGNHGAVPPGVESISGVCGTCHALNATLFASSPHKKAFDQRKLPECETCHGYHEIAAATDELLGVGPDAVCGWCHKQNVNQKGYLVAKTMRSLIDSLERSEQHADSLVRDAEQKGMEVSEARFKLRDVRQSRLQSRTSVHSFDLQKFREVVGAGLGSALIVAGEAKKLIEEYYFRRWGLGVASLIISVLAVSLYTYIRRIERRQRSKGFRQNTGPS